MPRDAPEDRRHWHTGCWRREADAASARTRSAQNAASSTSIDGRRCRGAASTDATSKRSVRARASGCSASQRMRERAEAALLGDRDRLGRRAERGRCARVFTSQNTTHGRRADARGRARPRGSASCGRAPRSRASTYQRATASSPASPSARRAIRRRSPPRSGSLPASSSMLTSLNVTTRTLATKRAGRYMSQTHASCSSSSK